MEMYIPGVLLLVAICLLNQTRAYLTEGLLGPTFYDSEASGSSGLDLAEFMSVGSMDAEHDSDFDYDVEFQLEDYLEDCKVSTQHFYKMYECAVIQKFVKDFRYSADIRSEFTALLQYKLAPLCRSSWVNQARCAYFMARVTPPLKHYYQYTFLDENVRLSISKTLHNFLVSITAFPAKEPVTLCAKPTVSFGKECSKLDIPQFVQEFWREQYKEDASQAIGSYIHAFALESFMRKLQFKNFRRVIVGVEEKLDLPGPPSHTQLTAVGLLDLNSTAADSAAVDDGAKVEHYSRLALLDASVWPHRSLCLETYVNRLAKITSDELLTKLLARLFVQSQNLLAAGLTSGEDNVTPFRRMVKRYAKRLNFTRLLDDVILSAPQNASFAFITDVMGRLPGSEEYLDTLCNWTEQKVVASSRNLIVFSNGLEVLTGCTKLRHRASLIPAEPIHEACSIFPMVEFRQTLCRYLIEATEVTAANTGDHSATQASANLLHQLITIALRDSGYTMWNELWQYYRLRKILSSIKAPLL